MSVENGSANQDAQFSEEDVNAAFADGGSDAPKGPSQAPAARVAEPEAEQVQEPVKQEQQATQATQAAPQAPVLTPELMAALASIPDLKRSLEQRVDKVAGNYGEVKRLLESMQKTQATPTSAAQVEAQADAWAELAKEFPELHGGISKGVSSEVQRALAEVKDSLPKSGVDPEQLTQLIRDAVSAARADDQMQSQQASVKELRALHPDFYAEKQYEGTEWADWRATLSPAQIYKLENSWDVDFNSAKIDEFKAWRAAQASKQQKSKSRIEDSVTPTSGKQPSGPSTESPEQAFLRGAGEL